MFNFSPAPTAQKFNLQKWVAMVSQQTLSRLDGATNVIPVIGSTGAGKSTFITVQLGGNFKRMGPKTIELTSCPLPNPKTSSSMESQTLHTSQFSDGNGNNFIDTGGLGENRGHDETLWVSFNLAMMFALAKQIRACVFVIDYTAICADRWNGVTALVEKFAPILDIPESDALLKSSVFSFTRATVDGYALAIEDIRNDVGEAVAAREKRQKERIATLPKVKNIGVKTDEIDWTAVPASTKAELKALQRELSFLNHLHQSQIVIGQIATEALCDAQRADFSAALNIVRPVQAAVLSKIARGFSDNLFNSQQAFGLLAERAAKYSRELRANYESVCDSLKKQEPQLEAITRDWAATKKVLSDQLAQDIVDSKAEMNALQNQIKSLSTSEKLVPMYEKRIFERQTGGFWAALGGGGWANESFSWKGQSFAKCEFEGDSCIDWKRSTKEVKYSGYINLNLESKRGMDIDLTLKLFVEEKNHSSTAAAMGTKQAEIDALKKKVELLSELSIVLAGTTDASSLRKYLVHRKEGKMIELQNSVESMETAITVPDNFPCASPTPTYDQCFHDLCVLLRIFKARGLISPDLTDSTRKRFAECIACHEAIANYKKEPAIVKFLDRHFSKVSDEAKRDADAAAARSPSSSVSASSPTETSPSSSRNAAAPSSDDSAAAAATAPSSWLARLLRARGLSLADEGEVARIFAANNIDDEEVFRLLRQEHLIEMNISIGTRVKLVNLIAAEAGASSNSTDDFTWLHMMFRVASQRSEAPSRVVDAFRQRGIDRNKFFRHMTEAEIDRLELPVGDRALLHNAWVHRVLAETVLHQRDVAAAESNAADEAIVRR